MTPSLQPLALRPHDVCVALQLVLSPEVPFRDLAVRVDLSLGEAHNSVKRPGAPKMVRTNQPLYRLLTVVDVLRVGRSQERKDAAAVLEEELVSNPSRE